MWRSMELKSIENYYVTLTSEKSAMVVNTKLKYYVKQAIIYKRLFLSLSCFIAVMNASIPVINLLNLTSNKLIITLISSISLVISGIFSLLSMKDMWYHYRSLAERLKRECNKFNARVCPYSSKSNRMNEILFILEFEEVTSEEQRNWLMEERKKEQENKEEMQLSLYGQNAESEEVGPVEDEKQKKEALKELCPYHQQKK